MKSGAAEKEIRSGSYNLILQAYGQDNFVFDLAGGAFSSRTLSEASEQVRKKAKEYSIIIGLLPSKNSNESVQFLFKRESKRPHFKGLTKEELFEKTKKSYEKFPPLFELHANLIVYTKGKTPEEIVHEIIEKFE
jgi:hypothetical protein